MFARAPWAGAVVLAAGACAGGGAPPTPDPAPAIVSRHQGEAVSRGVGALSVDADGVPRLVRAVRALPAKPGSTPEQAARAHLAALAPAYVKDARAADLALVDTNVLASGATIVAFRQEAGGLEVLHGAVRVLVDRDGALIAIGGTPRSASSPKPDAFVLTEAEALTAAATAWFGAGAAPELGDTHARKVLAPDGKQLVPAWFVEGYGATAAMPDAAFRVVLAADTGRVLERVDLVAADAFDYQVWADDDDEGRPYEGPAESFAPHPSGVPDGSRPAFVLPNLVTMDSFNAPGDSWLPDGATETRGNNVDAYVDLLGSANGFTAGDFRADVTSPGVFDRTYDTALEPDASIAQQKAAITQLFYTTNWYHDWYYDSGFDEAAGVAQTDNFGRGGVANDVMRAEAQDNIQGGSINNANMATPVDGLSPRMQMYVFSGSSTRAVSIAGGPNITAIVAAWPPNNFDVTAELVLADDGQAPPAPPSAGTVTDACEPLINDVTGKIVLVDRGRCTFESKVLRAQQAGAVGVVIANGPTAAPSTMGEDAATTGVTIGALLIPQADGNAAKAALLGGPVSAHLTRVTGVRRDGDLDVTVVAHEWGHYLHHRLTDCNSYQCAAMSEGWGDFVALHGQLRPADDPDGVFPLAVYDTVSFGDAYFGIRRVPYSVDRTKNDLSFRHISDGVALPSGHPFLTFGNNAEVHNAGEVWAAMLWDAYVALIDAHGYAVARRRMSDLVVAGLQLAPVDATYTETRDALALAAGAIAPGDEMIVLEAFALRGAGSCAVSPAPDDDTLGGVVESDQIAGAIQLGALTLDDDVASCDDDGLLDAGETGTVRVELANPGHAPVVDTEVTLATTTPGLEIVAPSVTVAALAPATSTTVEFVVRLDPSAAGIVSFDLSAVATNVGACVTTSGATATAWGNHDDVAAVSATETVDSAIPVWTRTGGGADQIWARTNTGGTDWEWHGVDQSSPTDTRLVTPDIRVSATDAFGVSFATRWRFETTLPTYWDGGVIEVSTDDGASWSDVTTLGVTPGYNATINGASGNVLQGRAAFGGTNPAFPADDTITLDFGTQLAGETVLLRFRIGTDNAAGELGWFLDDLAFTGIDNTPFGAIEVEAVACEIPEILDAGPGAPPDAGSDASIDPDADDAPDAEDAPDAGSAFEAGGDGGCCSTGGGPPTTGSLAPLATLLLVLRRRRIS